MCIFLSPPVLLWGHCSSKNTQFLYDYMTRPEFRYEFGEVDGLKNTKMLSLTAPDNAFLLSSCLPLECIEKGCKMYRKREEVIIESEVVNR